MANTLDSVQWIRLIGWLKQRIDGKRLSEIHGELREANLPRLKRVSRDTITRAARHAGFTQDERGVVPHEQASATPLQQVQG